MPQQEPHRATLNDILITEELSQRAPRTPDWCFQAQAMQSVARQMASHSQTLLQSLVDIALDLCNAGSAGVSLLEKTPNGEEVFRWNVLAGALAQYVGGTTKRDFSPCGVTLERGTPQLFSHPERYFTYFQAANTPIVEGLVLPLIADCHVLGTIWIMSHSQERHFDLEDVRIMTSWADFTATALLLQQRQTGELLTANAALKAEIAERKLSQEQLYALISNLPGEAAFVVDRDLRYLLAEGEALALAGFKREDLVGRTIFEVLPPSLAANYEPMYRRALAGEPFEQEHHAHNHTYISRGTPLRAENGEIYAVLVVSHDISDRKRFEEALRESERRLHATQNNVGIGIHELDEMGRYLRMNETFTRLSGYTLADFANSTIFDGIPIEDRDKVREHYGRLVRGEIDSYVDEGTYVTRDGYRAWVEVLTTAVRDDEGRFLYAVRAIHDVTQRRNTEEALRESEEKFRTFVNAASNIIYEMSADWGEMRFLKGKEFIASTENPRSNWIEEYIPETDKPQLWEAIDRAIASRSNFELEHRVIRLDGSVGWTFSCAIPVMNETGEIVKWFGAASDITARKHTEDALRESEEKYRSLFDTMSEGLAINKLVRDESGCVIDARYLELNPAYESQTGFDRSSALGRLASEVFPDYYRSWLEIVERVLRTGQPECFEHFVPDNQKWFVFNVNPFGGADCFVVFYDDITDRKRREANLAFLADIAEDFSRLSSADEIMRAVGAKVGTYLNISNCLFAKINEGQNQAIVEYTWHTPDTPDVRGVYRLSDFISEEFRQAARSGETIVIRDTQTDPRTVSDRYAALKIHAYVTVPFHREGEWRYLFTVNNSVARDWHEDEIELIREVTNRTFPRLERARAEAALRESEAKYRSLFDSIDEGFCIFEMIYNDASEAIDFRYIETNPAFERQSGRRPQPGQTMRELFPEAEDMWLKDYTEVARTGQPKRFIDFHKELERWFDVFVFPTSNGKNQLAALFSDVTDEKRAEAALRASEERQAFLLKLSDALRPLSDPQAIQATATEMLRTQLSAGWCYYVEWDEAAKVGVVLGDATREGLPSLAGVHDVSGVPEFLDFLRSGQVLNVSDFAYYELLSQRIRERYTSVGFRSMVSTPLVKNGCPIASLLVADTQPREWTEAAITLVGEVADRTWAAVERARAEASLRESEQRLSVIFAQAAVGLSEISLDGHFEHVNDVLCHMLGRSQEELLAATVPDVTYPDDVPTSLNALEQLLKTGESVSLDMRYVRPDGTVLWATSILTRLDNERGQPQRILAVTIDLSDRKLAEANEIQLIREQAAREEERQRVETLAELDRAKTLFFSNVSHEFRTPLTLILAPVQDALSDSVNPLPGVQRERLELVHCNTMRLLKLVNTLLDFSRIEAGRMEAVYEPTDLALYTTELASVFRSAIERACLRLVVDCPPLAEPVYVDRQMWEKIVLNLLSNAFKFTLEGEIAVRLHLADDHHVKLQVEDTGTGIEPEELPHLFERFYQVRGAIARTHEGSGIGLALVHELIEMHGGTVEVGSTVGQGSCFTVTIPLGTAHLPCDRLRLVVGDRIQAIRTLTPTALGATPYVQEAERWLPQEARGQGVGSRGEKLSQSPMPNSQCPIPRVLIVDDNADMRDYLTRILSKHVEVKAVADGAAALATVNEQLPDLVLSDVMMPELDGFKLLKALRADARTKEVPIILLSAQAGEESVIEGLQAGADDYLIKPFSATELVTRVNAYLQLAHLRSETLRSERIINHRKDEVLSTVSHELNTPLVAILGWTRLLRSSSPSPAMLMKSLLTIERNATLQAKLVQDLLDISRITAGKIRLNLEPVELQQVIDQAIATVRQSLETKDIRLDCLLDPLPTIVQGDPERLQQIILNLLTNAVKFTHLEGRIEISLQTDENQAQIIVSDTGCGIDGDFLPYIFDTFRQADGVKKGLGLGLAIARHLVELHGGTIHAKSPGIGQGTTFIVKFPLR
ncbi:PAS domain S-box protein [Scytonema sp. NUACC26]|uniref:PAS domain S-box protein n=1 Tax=Scytonema sp. NUACC26 TaxID=3140176 RepID=UPI0034DC4B63